MRIWRRGMIRVAPARRAKLNLPSAEALGTRRKRKSESLEGRHRIFEEYIKRDYRDPTIRHLPGNFQRLPETAPGRDLSWLRKLREDAFARFCEVGFPTTHDEDWRFTNVSAIAKTPFRLRPAVRSRARNTTLNAWLLPEAACQLVFRRRTLQPRTVAASLILPAGVHVNSLAGEIPPIRGPGSRTSDVISTLSVMPSPRSTRRLPLMARSFTFAKARCWSSQSICSSSRPLAISRS
jgi:hypothetical protein